MVKKKVDPAPSADSTQTRPPWRSTIRWTIARPMPDPGYWSRVWSRLNIWKIRSWYSGAIPIPLSLTENLTAPSSSAASTRIRGGSADRKVRALPIRFWKTCASWDGSARTTGMGPMQISAPVSAILSSSRVIASARAVAASTGVGGWPRLVIRE